MSDNPEPSYEKHQRVLLIGEADFSFAQAFAQEMINNNNNSSSRDSSILEISATEYGDGADIANRYYNGDSSILAKILSSLQNLHPIKEIMCGLNARQLGGINCTSQSWNESQHSWNNPTPFWNRGTENNPPFDLIIFNFPHSDQAGRATKLTRAFFKQIRICVNDGRLPPNIVVEMRLRILESNPLQQKNIRSFYKHEEAACESSFELIGNWPSDLHRWERLGYSHKWTRRDASCRDMGMLCNVWRWRPCIMAATRLT